MYLCIQRNKKPTDVTYLLFTPHCTEKLNDTLKFLHKYLS